MWATNRTQKSILLFLNRVYSRPHAFLNLSGAAIVTDLQSELDSKVRNLKAQGKRNNLLATVLYAAAGLASATATVWTAALVANKSAPTPWLAVLASIPGVALVLNETLKPEAKARWCYEKRAALEAILRDLKYSGVTDAEAVSKWNSLDIKMEREWPKFGSIASSPKQKSK